MIFKISGRRLIVVSLENGARETRVVNDSIIVRIEGKPAADINPAVITFNARYAIARVARRLGFSFFGRMAEFLGADHESGQILDKILPVESR